MGMTCKRGRRVLHDGAKEQWPGVLLDLRAS
jgi:hypothetical protein